MYITLEEKDYHEIANEIYENYSENGWKEIEIILGDTSLIISYYINIWECQEEETGAWITKDAYVSLENISINSLDIVGIRYDKKELEDIIENYFKN